MKIDACCTIGLESNFEETAHNLIRQMDLIGVDMAVIHPADHFYAWENEAGNQMLLDLSKKYEGRFIPTVVVNPWRSDAIEIVLKYVNMGAKMLSFSPGVQGLSICDKKIESLLKNIVRLNVNLPIYFHSGHHSNGAPTQLCLLAELFLNLNFILGHCGATDYASDVIPVCNKSPNIYMESSFARPPGFFDKLAKTSFYRGIMGSGYPQNDINLEWSLMLKVIPEKYQNLVLGENLYKLLEVVK